MYLSTSNFSNTETFGIGLRAVNLQASPDIISETISSESSQLSLSNLELASSHLNAIAQLSTGASVENALANALLQTHQVTSQLTETTSLSNHFAENLSAAVSLAPLSDDLLIGTETSSTDAADALLNGGEEATESGDSSSGAPLARTLSVSAQDLAGNSRRNAYNVGELNSVQSFQDFVGTGDRRDFYRFSLSGESRFDLNLTGLSDDADIYLLNENGRTINRSLSWGSTSESISQDLDAGTYYVRVKGYGSSSTDYTLEMSATLQDGAGNTLAAARNIGTLSAQQTFQDSVSGTSDPNDYYRFNLAQRADFSLSLSNLSADADVQLLDSSGKLLKRSIRSGSRSEDISLRLETGNYYVRVYPYNASTDYTLSMVATGIGPTDKAGNSLEAARDIGILSGSQSFQDSVGTADRNDYYRFSLSEQSDISLVLSGLTKDADLQLLDSNGRSLKTSTKGGARNENISQVLAAGTYYARVYPYSSAETNYRLTLSSSAATVPQDFDSDYGYGMVNAAAAVARAIGQTNPLSAVANLGGNNWGADMVNAPEAWAQGYTGNNVVVAVIDTGVDYNHVDLRNNIWVNTDEIAGNGIDDDGNGFVDDVRGWDFVADDNTPLDEDSHGTHVAGTIAATNNNTGVTGIAYDAQIMPVQVLGSDGDGSDGDVAAGIRYAADNGADVINLSLGGNSPSASIRAAIEYATRRGSFAVMASGNDERSRPDYPARYATDYGVAVGAANRNGQFANFSNAAGNDSDLQYVVAPGVSILSTTPGNNYRRFSGTSMATPHVAGVVALMLSANAELTHAQIRQILTESAVAIA